MSDRKDLLAALDLVRATAARLPPCDRAAHLHAMVVRIASSTDNGSSLAITATELARLAATALDDDPWVQFERAARQLLELASVHGPSRVLTQPHTSTQYGQPLARPRGVPRTAKGEGHG
jgi:hypothetical protein